MCGIAGFTTHRVRPDVGVEPVVRSMADAIRHRGPDGEGYCIEDDIALGHRRLSIIDIEGGTQPMTTPDGRFTLVYNGELYNYIELRATLETSGVAFQTSSDTEVFLHQLAQHGVGGLSACNGMFAFALWDRQEQTLLLARDRIGIKPLYYTHHEGELVFASEMKALLQYPGLSREISPLSVSKYLTYNYVPAPHTIFRGIRKLAPACALLYNGRTDTLREETYWDIPLEDNPLSTDNVFECAEVLKSLLRDSVKKRLRSDVPVGVFLSGGIDSSAITALAAQEVPGTLHTFSVGFEESTYDESPYARDVAERYGTHHHHEVLSSRRAIELFPEVMGMVDEPFGDASLLPTYLLSHFTAQNVKVVLGGDGGDELFAGYPSFQAHKVMEKLSILPMTWRDGLTRLARRLPVSHSYASLDFLLQQFFKGSGLAPEIRFILWMGVYGNDVKRQILSSSVQESLLRENPFEDVFSYVRQSGLIRDFPRLQYLCMKLYLQDDILTKVDRASMAHSLEVRVPFLDHHLVEYTSRIQPNYKLKGLTSKYVLKKAVQDLLPRSIIKRRKAGFMIPLASWLENELREVVEDVCSREAIEADGIFDADFVRTMLDDHFAQRKDYRKMIWTLMVFQLWRRHYGG